jgi:D-alanyl-D-alanine carboxypeptidase
MLGAAAMVAVSVGGAEARGRHGRHRIAAEGSYQPRYSSIVIDGNSGSVLQSTEADASRHPASLTKIMTLYLLFERLDAGKIKLTTEMPVSAHAAVQAPSKLGLKPGETIRVETAIRAIVTKSANDVAVIVAEALGGDEDSFAKQMTAKARALGMKRTVYRNASGLPDDDQITTARDQAVLGRAIQDRFPELYKYFSTRTFAYRGKSMRNHNHLLGTFAGVDGIKTGYIHDSGFNIVTSVRRGARHIIAVVFGGATADARDSRVRGLVESNIQSAALKRTAPPVFEGWDAVEERNKEAKDTSKDTFKDTFKDASKDISKSAAPEKQAMAYASPEPATAPSGSTDPIKPNPVKTVIVRAGAAQAAALSSLPSDSRKLMPAAPGPTTVTTVATTKAEPPPGAQPGILGVLPAKTAATVPSIPAPAKPRGKWMIQVGAFPEETEAKSRLTAAQSKAKEMLAAADPFTEKVAKGKTAMYRARFAGLDKDQADAACTYLKHNDIPCMALKN